MLLFLEILESLSWNVHKRLVWMTVNVNRMGCLIPLKSRWYLLSKDISDTINWTNTEPTPPITAGRTNENPEGETRQQVKSSPKIEKGPLKEERCCLKIWSTGSIDKRSKRGAMPELSCFMANTLRKVMSASAASHFPHQEKKPFMKKYHDLPNQSPFYHEYFLERVGTGLALQGMLSPKARGTTVPTKVDSTPQPLPSLFFFLRSLGLFICIKIHKNWIHKI